MFKKDKKEDFIQIEKCFEMIKKKEDINGNLKRISVILSRQFNSKKFRISIVDNDKQFFGMTCYPAESDLNRLVNLLITKRPQASIMEKYKSIDEWFIEIDSKLLYDRNLSANPAEITSVLLHEIGHIVYSDAIPNRLTKVILVDYLLLNNKIKLMIQNERLQSILGITAIETFAIKTFSSNPSKSEYVADKFAVNYGYGQDLDSFVDKLLKTQGSSLIDRSEKDMEQDLKLINQWAIENISELQYRKTKLRKMLKTEILSNPSPYVKEYVLDVKKKFFGKDEEQLVKQMVIEQSLNTICEACVKESLLNLFDKFGRVKKVTQQEIDDIFIDTQRMDNYDDAKYVLSKVQDKLEIIDKSLLMLEKDDASKVQQSKTSLLNMKKQLEGLRHTILTKKIQEKRKIILINYPEGYEG